MNTHYIETATVIAMMLIVVLCVWLGVAGPLTEAIVKASSGEWLSFAGSILGGLATLVAAIIAWIAVQRQISASRAAQEADRLREAQGLALLLQPTLIELLGRLKGGEQTAAAIA